MTSKTYATEERTLVTAPLETVRELVYDVEGWNQLHGPAVHAEFLERGADEDLIQQWSVLDDHTVRTWQARRWLENGGRRLVFVHEPAYPPFTDLRGGFGFERRAGGCTEVRMWHEFTLAEPDEQAAGQRLEAMHRSGTAYLETLRYAAENHAELAELTISFEDPLFVAGSIEDAYTYLYQADKWPERIPHVKRLVLEETTPNIQFFDMDTVSADGSEHTTRSVRICLPQHKIVYKQLQPPKTMDAHTGHWAFTQTPEGVIISSRHTATIKRSGLHLLGEDMTVAGARRYLRRVLSANSMGNLRLAKQYAEELAGV